MRTPEQMQAAAEAYRANELRMRENIAGQVRMYEGMAARSKSKGEAARLSQLAVDLRTVAERGRSWVR